MILDYTEQTYIYIHDIKFEQTFTVQRWMDADCVAGDRFTSNVDARRLAHDLSKVIREMTRSSKPEWWQQ